MILRRPIIRACLAGLLLAAAGCGTTRWSDTSRTATEQLLMSDAIERSISQIDFSVLAGRDVYLDSKYISGSVDEKYVVSTLRQHMFATGCVIHEKPEDATVIVEIRAGALGTNRSDLLFGVPATQLPTGGAFIGAPTAIPELPLIKRTAQQGVAKVAVFAYDRMTGSPVWQSGTRQQVSKAKDVWVFGTGPFQHGTIYDGAKFAGERLKVPVAAKKQKQRLPSVSGEVVFEPVPREIGAPARLAVGNNDGSVVTPASANSPSGATGSAGAITPLPPAAGAGPSAASPSSSSSTSSSGATGSSSSGSSPTTGSSSSPSGSSTGSSTSTSTSNGTSISSATALPAGSAQAVQMVDWAKTVLPAR